MSERDVVEAILYERYAGPDKHDKRLKHMLANLCARYPSQVDSVRYWFDLTIANRPAWWLRDPLFLIHACGHVEQRFAPTETEAQWLRYRSGQAWMEFSKQRKRDNALLRKHYELAHLIMRECDEPGVIWDKAALKSDWEGDVA